MGRKCKSSGNCSVKQPPNRCAPTRKSHALRCQVQKKMGLIYYIRTTRAIEFIDANRQYFEFSICTTPDAKVDAELEFDKGANISLGIGIASEEFNVGNSTQGWVAENDGIGYYNGNRQFLSII
jgi:hypothetical protein